MRTRNDSSRTIGSGRAPRTSWPLTRTLLWLCWAVVPLAAVTGCGSKASGEPDFEIRLTYVEEPGAEPKNAVLTCTSTDDPADGGQRFCDVLAALPPDAFDPVDPDRPCTKIWGGPQTARIVGHWQHGEIDAEFNRSGGCEIARWDVIKPLLVAAGLI